MSRIAFYAPIKPPDHPIASGDRLIARNLISALELAEFEVELASSFIAYSKREAPEIMQQRKQGALDEATNIVNEFKRNPPDMWVTYHPYCKAPDWIGPFVAHSLEIPYVTIEAARTGQGFENGGDRWNEWRKEAQDGIMQADLHIAFKPQDRDYIASLTGNDQNIKMLAPFLNNTNEAELPPVTHASHWRENAPVLLTVGMMRPGKKLENYRRIAHALEPLQALHWNWIAVGDGPERNTIEDMFSAFDPNRIQFVGALSPQEVLSHMAKADLFIWPGWKEPIGMVYLEAQMMGLPVAALDSMGVSLTVKHGETGLLSAENDPAAFSENLAALISHPSLRTDMGKKASQNILKNHSLNSAAHHLRQFLTPYLRP